MIANDIGRKAAIRWAEEFERAAENAEGPKLRAAEIAAMRSQAQSLRCEIAEYEATHQLCGSPD